MYDGYSLAILLTAIGIVLMLGEALLPTHGLLGVAGGASVLIAIFVAARENAWVGLAMLLALVAATPIVWALFLKIWPRTPAGRRLILPEIVDAPAPAKVRVGQAGVTVSELRPIGTCEFDGERVEAISEHGIVPPGTQVKVIALNQNRPTVRVA